MALAQLGAKMASTPGTLLQAASAGIQEALPGAAAAAKERRGEERALTRELLAEERLGNKEQETRASIALDMLKNYNTLEQAYQDRSFRDIWESLGRKTQLKVAQISGMYGLAGTRESAAATLGVGRMGLEERRGAVYANTLEDLIKNAAIDDEFMKKYGASPLAARAELEKRAREATEAAFGGGYGPPPAGSVTRTK